jgi:hypothetical protein
MTINSRIKKAPRGKSNALGASIFDRSGKSLS